MCNCVALVIVLASLNIVDLPSCFLVAPSSAVVSAVSLQSMLQWEGILCKVTVWALHEEIMSDGRLFSSLSCAVWRACGMDRASVEKTTLLEVLVMCSL